MACPAQLGTSEKVQSGWPAGMAGELADSFELSLPVYSTLGPDSLKTSKLDWKLWLSRFRLNQTIKNQMCRGKGGRTSPTEANRALPERVSSPVLRYSCKTILISLSSTEAFVRPAWHVEPLQIMVLR